MRQFLYRYLWGLVMPRWWLKQKLAGKGYRYYGDGGTIHHSGQLDVETFHGTVVAVWFRCQPLPFHQVEVESNRAIEMEEMSWGNDRRSGVNKKVDLAGVEVSDAF